jgi:hypothetical protein
VRKRSARSSWQGTNLTGRWVVIIVIINFVIITFILLGSSQLLDMQVELQVYRDYQAALRGTQLHNRHTCSVCMCGTASATVSMYARHQDLCFVWTDGFSVFATGS